MSELPTHTETDEVHAHPRHTGRGWFDLIAAVTALAISGISLFVGIEHSETESKLVAANSWPILMVAERGDDYSDHGQGLVSIPAIKNAGVGPAKIERFTMYYAGKPMRSYGELLRSCCDAHFDDPTWEKQLLPQGIGQAPVEGEVLRPAETINMLEVRSPTQPLTPFHTAFNAAMTKLSFHACYCSVFDECWESDLKTLHPTPVKECPKNGAPDTLTGL